MKRVSLKTLSTIFVSAFLMVVVTKPLVAQVALNRKSSTKSNLGPLQSLRSG
jgi:hypothetical protein